MSLSAERTELDERYAKGQREPLIAGYQSLAESEPDAGLYRRLGICLDDAKQLEPAKAAFRKALSLDHSDSISKRRILNIDFAINRANAKAKAVKPPKAPRAKKAPVELAPVAEVSQTA